MIVPFAITLWYPRPKKSDMPIDLDLFFILLGEKLHQTIEKLLTFNFLGCYIIQSIIKYFNIEQLILRLNYFRATRFSTYIDISDIKVIWNMQQRTELSFLCRYSINIYFLVHAPSAKLTTAHAFNTISDLLHGWVVPG